MNKGRNGSNSVERPRAFDADGGVKCVVVTCEQKGPLDPFANNTNGMRKPAHQRWEVVRLHLLG